MTSEAFVWLYPPGQLKPVVCGRVFETPDGGFSFVYGRSYRARDDAFALAPEGMGLDSGPIPGRMVGTLPGPIRDAAPDAWARFAIAYRKGVDRVHEIEVLLSGSGERIGALEFSDNPESLVAPTLPETQLADMEAAARGAQEGGAMPPELLDALRHGTTIGGARPKATFRMGGEHWIAKFSSSTDQFRVVRWEAATLALARQAKITVPDFRLIEVNGRDVLLVKRFDRERGSGGFARRLMLSALTLLDLDETEARLAAYSDFSEVLLRHARRAGHDRAELFRRMVFNIAVGNEDDHAKNHACFWDGRWLELTPAYDILPQRRVGLEGRQAMLVGMEGATSTLRNALSNCAGFGLTAADARHIIEEVIDVIEANWMKCFAEYGTPEGEVEILRGRTVLSPVATAL